MIYLVKDIRDILFIARFLNIAQLRHIFGGQQAIVSHQGHALVGNLVAFKVDLVIIVT